MSNILNKIAGSIVSENRKNKAMELAQAAHDTNIEFQEIINKDIYIDSNIKDEFILKFKGIEQNKPNSLLNNYILNDNDLNELNKLKYNIKEFSHLVKLKNKNYVIKNKAAYSKLFKNIEGRALDDQQIECIVKDDVNNLVIAGAGSGKTTTIVGKVKYLLEKDKYKPEELLVLSFTNASASEMKERISKETKADIDVMTFHKLGKEIIAAAEEKQPDLTSILLHKFVNETFKKKMDNDNFKKLILDYFLSYIKEYKSQFEFKNKGEYYKYLRDNDIVTFMGEKVKSYQEMEIANFLFINNIKYEYERKYEILTSDMNYSQYHPDFYLPDYKIYIEHFGIDKSGNVPSYFKGKDGKSAKETYNDGIAWKRNIHKQNNTILVETYSYEKENDVLITNLKKKLLKYNVVFKELSDDEKFKIINEKSKLTESALANLISTFICLIKANSYSINDIENKNQLIYSGFNRIRNSKFINIVKYIYDEYEYQLSANREIDFNDMINKATGYVKNNMFNKKYSYIIVDEFQDISYSRYNLIKSIKDKNKSKLFCVGDDWQSIYRFAGSDINFFTKFNEYFGETETSHIETTYRFPQSIIDISSRFILKNNQQISKNLHSFNSSKEKSFELVYSENQSGLKNELKNKLIRIPRDSSVLLIGRYNDDIRYYLDDEISCKVDHHTNKKCLIYNRRRDLNIEFMTAHSSKGLQADFIFIINNTSGSMGFPSKINDDSVINLVLQKQEKYPFAEERRLFYVALTRAKKFVYILVNSSSKSVFIKEIEEEFSLSSDAKVFMCPECETGKLVVRSGKYGDFYGCSNYPMCKHTEKITYENKIE